jgi:chromosome segregation ATPase
MLYVIAGMFIVISVGAAFAAFHVGKKSGSHATDSSIAELREEARELEDKLVKILANAETFTSAKQLEALGEAVDKLTTQAEALKNQQGTVQQKIREAEKLVLEREQEHQNLRTVTAEDRSAVESALSSFEEASSECMSLENRLADSLQTLDAMYSEVSMTEPQKAMFEELSNAVTLASSQLRDVIVDYESAHERLSILHARFGELETEYSALIEKQLLG